MSSRITESDVEELCLNIFENLGYEIKYGPDIYHLADYTRRGNIQK